jgi:hypothetical protein
LEMGERGKGRPRTERNPGIGFSGEYRSKLDIFILFPVHLRATLFVYLCKC